MKKLLLSVLTAAMAMPLYAETATVVFSELGYENGDDVLSVKVNDDVSLMFAEGDGFRDAAYFEADECVRLFCGNTLTVSLSAGTMTDISFVTAGGNYDFTADNVTADSGLLTPGAGSATWTGSASAVKFQNMAESGNVRISKMTITYSAGEASAVAKPAMALVENDYNFTIEMTCATEGAEIRYTLDGSEPSAQSPLYSAPVEIWESATVKAIALKDDAQSDVAVFEASVPEFLTDFSALADKAGTSVLVKAPMTAVYHSGRYIFLTCGGMYTMLVNTFNLPVGTLSNGDMIKRMEGRVTEINGQVQIVPTSIGEVSQGEAVKAAPMQSAANLESLMNHYITLENAAISALSGTDATITCPDGSAVALTNLFGMAGIAEGDNLNVTGFAVGAAEGPAFAPVAIEQAGKVFTDPVALEAIEEFAGTYVWELYEEGLSTDMSLSLTFTVSDLRKGELDMSGRTGPGLDFTVKAYLDPEARTLTINSMQNLGEDKYGDVQYFYIKDGFDDNGASPTKTATVGEVTGRRVTFPASDVWAIADPATEEEVGYWMLAFRHVIYKKGEAVDMDAHEWEHFTTALFEDGWLTSSTGTPADTPWAVEVERAADDESLLRIVSPYMAEESTFAGEEGYIVLSMADHDFVKVFPNVFSGYQHMGYPLLLFNLEGFFDMLGYDREWIETYPKFYDNSYYDVDTKIITIYNCRYNFPGSGNSAYVWSGDSGESLADKMVARLHLDYDPASVISPEAAADGEAEYYNLQGIRVTTPAAGIYIRRCGTETKKVRVN